MEASVRKEIRNYWFECLRVKIRIFPLWQYVKTTVFVFIIKEQGEMMNVLHDAVTSKLIPLNFPKWFKCANWDALGLSMYMTQLYLLKNSWLQRSQLVYMEITCRREAFSCYMNRRNRNKICLHGVKIIILGDVCSLFEQV